MKILIKTFVFITAITILTSCNLKTDDDPSLSQLSKFRAGSDEALNLLNSKIETCTGYLCLAINGMSDLFPDQKTKIDPYANETIEKWKYIFKNFNS